MPKIVSPPVTAALHSDSSTLKITWRTWTRTQRTGLLQPHRHIRYGRVADTIWASIVIPGKKLLLSKIKYFACDFGARINLWFYKKGQRLSPFVHVLNTRIQLTMSRREKHKYLARWCFTFRYKPCPNKFAITSGHTRETSFSCYYTTSQKRNTRLWLSLPSHRDIIRGYSRNGVLYWRWTTARYCLWPGYFCIHFLLSSN